MSVFFLFFNDINLNPPPIAAPTTILRQPLNVLYRTPVEAVKLKEISVNKLGLLIILPI